MGIIEKLRKSKLTGRGGAGYPTADKWEAVANQIDRVKYVVCNGSEGEPGITKDGFLLEKYPEDVVEGVLTAINYIEAKKGILFLKQSYYKKFADNLRMIIGKRPIEIFSKSKGGGYIAGEESALLNCIEGRRVEPRRKPPYPTEFGLWGHPTIVNNIETFYAVSLIKSNEYTGKRLVTISGDCVWDGVYFVDENKSISNILKETNNYPDYDFFVQLGGAVSGEVFDKSMLDRKLCDCGSITMYSYENHSPIDLIKNWVNFYVKESCGYCTPCREGTYRLNEIMLQKERNWPAFAVILDTLKDTSFCGLGCSIPVPFKSFVKNVLPNYSRAYNQLPKGQIKKICESFR